MCSAPLLLAGTLALWGCGPATYNVRAARAYANEDANPAVIDDRAADLAAAAALADELLLRTPYSPGDAWVRTLHLDDDEADTLRARYEDAPPYSGAYEVPLAKLYRLRIEQALARARSPRAAPPRHASVLDALAAVAPEAKELPAAWKELVEARRSLGPEGQGIARLAAAQRDILDAAGAIRAAGPRQGEQALIARDALNVLSFVLRMHIEALAVAPYVIKQARRVARDDRRYRHRVAGAEVLRDLLDEERAALDLLTEALTGPASMPLSDAAGYEMHEGLFSQAAAINFDAIHVKLKGDAELLLFNAVASANASGATNNYTGRTRRLTYDVDPVFMVGGRIILTYDFAHVRNAASLNAGFRTNRLFSAGGDLEYDSSLGELIGLDGIASDFFDIGADLLGFTTSVKLCTFTSGEVSEIAVDPATGRDAGVLARAPFQLKYHQIDVGFDLTTLFPEEAEEMYVESLLLGFRYMDYELPRIFYVLSQKDPGNDNRYIFERQSPPQSVKSVFYQGGFTVRFGNGEWARVSPFGDLGLYGGAGPVNYYFTQDPATAGGAREPRDATMLALSGNASLGLRLRLTSYMSRPRLVTELSYNVEAVGQGIVSSIRAIKREDETTYTVDQKIDLGGFDLFHGPRLLAVLVF